MSTWKRQEKQINPKEKLKILKYSLRRERKGRGEGEGGFYNVYLQVTNSDLLCSYFGMMCPEPHHIINFI